MTRSLLNVMISYILYFAEINCFKLSQIIKIVLTEGSPKLFQGITINPRTAKSSTDVPLCPKLSSCSKLRLIIMFHALQYILELFVNQYYILFDARLELYTEHIAFPVSITPRLFLNTVATLLLLRSFTLLYIKQFFLKSTINKTASFYKRSYYSFSQCFSLVLCNPMKRCKSISAPGRSYIAMQVYISAISATTCSLGFPISMPRQYDFYTVYKETYSHMTKVIRQTALFRKLLGLRPTS
jgi:hypothetical protein